MNRTAGEIETQYRYDCSDLLCHLQFLSRKTRVTDTGVADVNAALRQHGLEPLRGRTLPPQGSHMSYSPTEAAELLQEAKATGSAVWRHYTTCWGQISALIKTREVQTWGNVSEKAIQFAVGLFATNTPTPEELDSVRVRVEEYLAGVDADSDGRPISIDLIMNCVQHRPAYQEIRQLQALEGRLYELRWAAVSHDPTQYTGIYRQAFILLMTHFDATVFDLTRLALRTNFFGLVPIFGQREKISYDRMGQHRDFESLRESLIDDLLKARYLKDLLFDLRRLGVTLPDDPQLGFPRLIELTLRRNIHLHNRGVVDSRYLESGVNGRPMWNLDNLSLGATAAIDPDYWHRAYSLCGQYADLLARWIESGAVAISSA